jgi:single-stranded-DNA-specific exonuclease
MSKEISLSDKKWEIEHRLIGEKVTREKLVSLLLEKRGIREKEEKNEFFNPIHPVDIDLEKTGIKSKNVKKLISRVNKAREEKQKVVVYGDYDADGVCATAILWEVLYQSGVDAMPFIPDRFEDGYGINAETINKLHDKYPNLELIITVDNGIVAFDAVDEAKKIGIEVVVTDHHDKEKKTPKALSVIHTTDITGAGIAWFIAREIAKGTDYQVEGSLELAGIGTLADQAEVLGINRSLVKHGLDSLNKSNRVGLKALFKEAGVKQGSIGTYTVGFIIAPRLNAAGRMEDATDSLRLLCTKSPQRAEKLALKLGKTNYERQKKVESVSLHAKQIVKDVDSKKAVLVSHESYHEGVIGLVASKMVEEYYKPSIVISQGDELSKASARSISGFNIIDAIRKLDNLIEKGGGHPMAAGFSIKTENIEEFVKEFNILAESNITDDVLLKRLKVDAEVELSLLDDKLANTLKKFEPTGIGNPTPCFLTRKVNVLDVRAVGRDNSHLKMKLEKDDCVFDAIAFGFGKYYAQIMSAETIDVVYALDENIWQGVKSLQLKIKDVSTNQNE